MTREEIQQEIKERDEKEERLIGFIIGIIISAIIYFVFYLIFLAILGWLLMICYNFVIPSILIGAPTLVFWQSFLIVILLKILGMIKVFRE